jgi:hypothetical protein
MAGKSFFVLKKFHFFFSYPLQDFIVLPMEIFYRYVIQSWSIIFLPTKSSMENIHRLTIRR